VGLETFKPLSDTLEFYYSATLTISTNGMAEAPFKAAADGEYEIVVNASGSRAKNEGAKFRLQLDGKDLSETFLTTEEAEEHSLTADLKAGDHKLGIQFVNDDKDEAKGEDRDLAISAVQLFDEEDAATTLDLKAFKPVGDVTTAINASIGITSNGVAEAPVKIGVEGTYQIDISAAGTQIKGEGAKFKVQIDGKDVGEALTPAADGSQPCAVKTKLSAGAHKLGIQFINDLNDEEEGNRDLYIYSVELTQTD
jgi:hypothetical protein